MSNIGLVIGNNIYKLLEKNNMSVAELADILDIEIRNLYRYINSERRPQIELLIELCAVFKVTIDYLVTEH